jgi:DnaJ-class molecular chaperone
MKREQLVLPYTCLKDIKVDDYTTCAPCFGKGVVFDSGYNAATNRFFTLYLDCTACKGEGKIFQTQPQFY